MKIAKWIFLFVCTGLFGSGKNAKRGGYVCLIILTMLGHEAMADSATGPINIWATGAGDPNFQNTFFVQFKSTTSSAPGNTASCVYGLITTSLSGDGNKAMYATLLAAVSTGRQVTLNYIATPGIYTGCTLTQVSMQ